jgi:hypothetical protein
MNLEFTCLIIILTLLILLVTFGDLLSPSGFSQLISTSSNYISAKSLQTIGF